MLFGFSNHKGSNGITCMKIELLLISEWEDGDVFCSFSYLCPSMDLPLLCFSSTVIQTEEKKRARARKRAFLSLI